MINDRINKLEKESSELYDICRRQQKVLHTLERELGSMAYADVVRTWLTQLKMDIEGRMEVKLEGFDETCKTTYAPLTAVKGIEGRLAGHTRSRDSQDLAKDVQKMRTMIETAATTVFSGRRDSLDLELSKKADVVAVDLALRSKVDHTEIVSLKTDMERLLSSVDKTGSLHSVIIDSMKEELLRKMAEESKRVQEQFDNNTKAQRVMWELLGIDEDTARRLLHDVQDTTSTLLPRRTGGQDIRHHTISTPLPSSTPLSISTPPPLSSPQGPPSSSLLQPHPPRSRRALLVAKGAHHRGTKLPSQRESRVTRVSHGKPHTVIDRLTHLEHLVETMAMDIHALHDAIKGVDRRLGDTQAQVNQLAQRIECLERKSEDHDSQLSIMRDKVSEISETSVAQMEEFAAESSKRQTAMEAIQEATEFMKRRLAQLQKQIDTRSTSADERNDAFARELEAVKAQVTGKHSFLEQDIEVLRREVAHLKGPVADELANLRTDMDEKRDEYGRMQGQLRQVLVQFSDTSNARRRAESELHHLSRQLSTKSSRPVTPSKEGGFVPVLSHSDRPAVGANGFAPSSLEQQPPREPSRTPPSDQRVGSRAGPSAVQTPSERSVSPSQAPPAAAPEAGSSRLTPPRQARATSIFQQIGETKRSGNEIQLARFPHYKEKLRQEGEPQPASAADMWGETPLASLQKAGKVLPPVPMPPAVVSPRKHSRGARQSMAG
ncbi:unnamed protein product [Vitrella brassicaformis CCMP3155]|uniref:Uncharacterized protein n=2 Tax=Vitrella brassicaformis TaxID=1169539 RepID=A0A0G4FKG3_VITBC|nr:unnamed protein product [Vitrella brassicaformis CCMP3155]|eukprot:CEM14065.1 unnamed protein product [Vitrella brassicaformis CCMP3155]